MSGIQGDAAGALARILEVVKAETNLGQLETTVQERGRIIADLEGETTELRAELKAKELTIKTTTSLNEGLMQEAARLMEQRDKLHSERADVNATNEIIRLLRLEVSEKDRRLEESRTRELQLASEIAGLIKENETLRNKQEQSNAIAAPVVVPSNRPAKREAATKDEDVKIVDLVVDVDSVRFRVPASRRLDLDTLPIHADEPRTSDYFMKRGFLSQALGGNPQAAVVKITDACRDLARELNIRHCLFPKLDHNPWCPMAPGQHGYVFIGLPGERNYFDEEDIVWAVFVGEGPDNRTLYKYVGQYRISRAAALSKEEWHSLPGRAKTTYSKTTSGRLETHQRVKLSPEQCRVQYDEGILQVPCLRLEYLSFNQELHDGLRVSHSTSVFASSSASQAEGSPSLDRRSSGRVVKKRKTSQ